VARIKETTIGHRVSNRPEDYDPKADGIVRTEAVRLRKRLAKAQKADDPVFIVIPKGTYVPEFRFPSARSKRVLQRYWKFFLAVLVVGACVLVWSRLSKKHLSQPKIEFTTIPQRDCGGPVRRELIAGKVSGVMPGQYKLVIYSEACNRVLYIEPDARTPFTTINSDGTFNTYIYLGEIYYAMLVKLDFKPEPQLPTPPQKGRDIILVAAVPGKVNR
jgi:hypothetical protein